MHRSVMPKEILKECINSQNIIDCTFGYGGHSELILENTNASLQVLDRDIDTHVRFKELEDIYKERITFANDLMSNVEKYINKSTDTIIMDLGLSQTQIKSRRGFSFRSDDPIDMTMGLNKINGQTILNTFAPSSLRSIFQNNGANINVNQVVNSIVKSRPILSTFEFVQAINKVLPSASGRIYARYFQALRITTNNEIEEIKKTLKALKSYSNIKICILTFHSIEFNIVKAFMDKSTIKSKILRPTPKETIDNKNSSSANLFTGIII